MTGVAGVIMNQLITPMLRPTANDLIEKFSAAVLES